MKIAITTDEIYPLNQFVVDYLKKQGHEVILCGALRTQQEESWVGSAHQAAQLIVDKQADEGIFFCWTGTGISMAANRFKEIRAALCVDAETARAARIWNHANVLVLSNRLTSQDIAKEILSAWFEPYDPARGQKYIQELDALA